MSVSKRAPRREIIPMLTADEVAERLGIKRSAVYNLSYKLGGLRSYKVGGLLRFKPDDVEAWKKGAPPGGSNT